MRASRYFHLGNCTLPQKTEVGFEERDAVDAPGGVRGFLDELGFGEAQNDSCQALARPTLLR